ncbi:ligand-gated ion channel domain-containing protein [Phthorimaea operculella]|nr:ligand-gated ion channel domain-containing protein [Phthorimaea operculella]
MLSSVDINVACSFQPNRGELQLQHIVIIADLACPGVDSFLQKASDEGYFKSPYRWLLLDDQNGNLDILDHLEMLVNSDVVLARKSGQDVHFVEVYRFSANSEVIKTTRSIWHPPSHITSSNFNNPLTYEEINNSTMTNNENTTKTEDSNKITAITNENNNNIAISKEAISNALVKEDIKAITVTATEYGVIEDFRKTKVLSVRRKNLRGHTLTMVNVITDSNNTRNHLDDRLYLHQDSITKMSYAAVKICFEMLNASEKLLFTHTWGYRDKNGNWQGIVDHLLKKEADLGTLTIFTQERMQVVDYIAMVGSTSVRFVFREPPLAYISNIFALPFTGAVWLAILVCVLGCSVVLYITSKWEASMGMHPLQLDGSWADVLILAIGAVLQQGCTLEPRYAAGRCVTLFLFVTLTVLYSAYSANIVVLLRAPSSSVRSLPDLLNSPLKLGASDFEYNRYFFKKLNEPIRKAIYDKKIAPKGKKANFYSMEEGIEKVRKGLFAFHMELNPGYRLIQETYQEHEKCDLVEIDYINEIDPWVPGQKRSPFKDMFKINFMKFRESGIQACIHNRLHVPKPKCSGTVATFSSVGIRDMLPALLATLYGMLLAPAVLLLEIAYKHLLVMRRNRIRNLKALKKLRHKNMQL